MKLYNAKTSYFVQYQIADGGWRIRFPRNLIIDAILCPSEPPPAASHSPQLIPFAFHFSLSVTSHKVEGGRCGVEMKQKEKESYAQF
jgi:hypothetical protein